jgi:hypothetical protein
MPSTYAEMLSAGQAGGGRLDVAPQKVAAIPGRLD